MNSFQVHAGARALVAVVWAACLAVTSWSAAAADAKASRYYEDALIRYDKQDLPGAIIQLKNALQIDKTMLPVQLLLGKALLANGEVGAAEVAFNEALRLGVDRAEVVVPMARALLAQGKHRTLLDSPQFAMGGLLSRVQMELWVLRASALSDLGDARGALHAVEQARLLDPRSPDPWLAEVPIRIRARQLTEAAAAADKALALAPKLPEARYQRGSVYHVQGDQRAAIAAYSDVLALDPQHVEARVARAGLFVDTGRLAEAAADLAHMQRVAEREPRSAYLRALLADRDGKPAQAKAHLAQVTALLDPVPVEFIQYRYQLLLLNGLAHLGLGEDEKARAYLEALQRVHGVSPASKLLAQILLQSGEMERGINVLEAYVRQRPGDSDALMRLASAYMAQGRNAPAITLMQEALRGQDDPGLRAMLGQGLLGSGQVSLGTGELEAALHKDPGQAQAGSLLAGLYLRAGEGAKAVKVTQELVKRHPNHAGFQDLLGMALAQAGNPAQARSAFERAISLDGSLLGPKLHLARLEIALRNYDAADRQLQGLLRDDDKSVDTLMELALLAERRGQSALMQQWLQKAFDHSDTRELRPALALVDLHLREGRAGPALEVARRLQANAPPDHLGMLLAYGRALAANGDTARARTAFTSASRVSNVDPAMQVRVAALQLGVGDADGAAYLLDKALATRPGLLSAQALMVEVELARKDFPAAERRARQLVEQHPKRAVGHRLAGDVAMARGQTSAASDAYRRAHQVEPSPDTFGRLFSALWSTSDGGKAAIQLASQWSQQRPQDLAAKRVLADAQARAGHYASARVAYEQLLKLAPQDAGLMNNLANVLIRQKDPGAVALAERAVALAPTDPNALDTLGWALFQAGGGHRDRAVALLRDARLRAPANPAIRYHLAVALAQAGRAGEARSEVTAALDANAEFEQRAEAEALLKTLR